jgi:hypothetical protein
VSKESKERTKEARLLGTSHRDNKLGHILAFMYINWLPQAVGGEWSSNILRVVVVIIIISSSSSIVIFWLWAYDLQARAERVISSVC